MTSSPVSDPDSDDLIRVGFATRRDRFYRTVVWADLFGGVFLVRQYGQLGRASRMHLAPRAIARAPASAWPA